MGHQGIKLQYKIELHNKQYSFVLFQPTPASKFLQGYVGAVGSAVSIAVSVFLV